MINVERNSFEKKCVAQTNAKTFTRINQIVKGWINYFRIGRMKNFIDEFGQWLRHKIRVIILKQWKVPPKIYKNLQKLNEKLPYHFSDEQLYSVANTRLGLYKQANGNLEKAQRGIIVFDEFDKLANSSENGLLEMKKAVQQQLLDFMGGGTYEIVVGDNPFNMRIVSFDTSKLTFVCLAALTDLRDKKTQKKQIIGFGNRTDDQNNESYTITVEDLIDIGLKKELAGRFNTFLHTEEYSKESLLRILKESTISPIAGFEKWITSHGKKLIIEDGVYEAIADAAYDLNTGARSLQTVMNNIRTPFLKEVLRGKEETIYLDVDTVKNITEETVKRKVRK